MRDNPTFLQQLEGAKKVQKQLAAMLNSTNWLLMSPNGDVWEGPPAKLLKVLVAKASPFEEAGGKDVKDHAGETTASGL